MQKSIRVDLDAPADHIAEILRDLARYPSWLEIVSTAVPADAIEGDVGPAWLVTLRARVGPLARSKRLRMVRTVDEGSRLRFERAELDGRDHAEWTLEATILGEMPSRVDVELSYDGGLWSTPLEKILGSQIDDAIPRLRELVEG